GKVAPILDIEALYCLSQKLISSDISGSDFDDQGAEDIDAIEDTSELEQTTPVPAIAGPEDVTSPPIG
ncbi:MAG: hypothetical protein ABJN51_15450, partial [Sneathiella sp.]